MKLKRISGAYATMTYAVYEPMILKWVSGYSLDVLASSMAWRMHKANKISTGGPTARILHTGTFQAALPANFRVSESGQTFSGGPLLDKVGNVLSEGLIKPVEINGYPNAVQLGDNIYLNGIVNVEAEGKSIGWRALARFIPGRRNAYRAGKGFVGAKTVPLNLNRRIGFVDENFDFAAARKKISDKLLDAAKNQPAATLADSLRTALKNVDNLPIYEFLPIANIEEALSPIGVANYFRQHYFNIEEGVGPVEHAFTIAPHEKFEVVYETVRKQIHEEVIEQGIETVSESAIETKNLDEVSDKVSSMMQRDSSASMSVTGSYSTGVWSVGASASANLSNSSKRARDTASRRVKDVTKRASERITKSFSVKTRDLDELTTTNLTRRIIDNPDSKPVSYGLRRVLRKVAVKVQDLGPRAVWQLYVRNPGEGLAGSQFVHFRESDPIAPPNMPPGIPPRPKGGIDTGSSAATVDYNGTRNTHFVTLTIVATSDRVITSVTIDAITDLEGGGKDDPSASPKNDVQWGQHLDESTNTYTVNIGVKKGDAKSVSVSYSYTWEPSSEILDEWETKRQQAIDELTQEALTEQFEREKALITEKSKVRSRPANELRQEERYEVMNRMISHLFATGDDPSEPTPLEIEYFHRYFEIERMFIYMHPSWWKPRFASDTSGFNRKSYEITADSDPAPLGSSLGWRIQTDGDNRRNAFVNSPWVRVCIPITPSYEEDAIDWLKTHVEGDIGFDKGSGPIKDLLNELKAIRDKEVALGANGDDYVTVDSTAGAPADPAKPEGVFPVVDEFDVTVPTDGFVYEKLEIDGS